MEHVSKIIFSIYCSSQESLLRLFFSSINETSEVTNDLSVTYPRLEGTCRLIRPSSHATQSSSIHFFITALLAALLLHYILLLRNEIPFFYK